MIDSLKSIFDSDEQNDLEEEMDAFGLDDDEKELVRSGEWEPWQFEEDNLEEDDYYNEDDL